MVNRGFTLVEMLVVMAVVALLAVVVIAAVQPMEQIRKSRDVRRLGDAKQLFSAYENYFASFREYPWGDAEVQLVDATLPSSIAAIAPDFLENQDSFLMIERGELKPSFVDLVTIKQGELLVSLPDGERVTVCFEPESNRGRQGGMGTIVDRFGHVTSPDCAVDYQASTNCFLCVH